MAKRIRKLQLFAKKTTVNIFLLFVFVAENLIKGKKYIKIENVYFFHYLLALLLVIKSFIGFKTSSFFGIFLLLLD
jgi:hypothetical protein